MQQLVLATRNKGKTSEMRALLAGMNIELLSALDVDAPEIDEDQPTLEGNARKKAEALYAFTGMPSLADDTGLEVSALDGRPGVFSARFAGPESDDAANRRLLLHELRDVENRSARFRTVVAFVDETGVHLFEGICPGTILHEERGSGGFGYDALFQPEGFDETFAELPAEIKNAVSHRGRALRQFAEWLQNGSSRDFSGPDPG